MTFNNIYEYFKDDSNLLEYFDPLSKATNNSEAAMEVYHKLIDHSKDRKCKFVRNDIGYIFYAKKELISFCIKPEFRSKENYIKFWNLIKEKVGKNFKCWLYTRNTRGINYLEKSGMKIKESNKLITLLTT